MFKETEQREKYISRISSYMQPLLNNTTVSVMMVLPPELANDIAVFKERFITKATVPQCLGLFGLRVVWAVIEQFK